MERLLDPSTYIDKDKLPKFVDLVEEFSKQELSHLWVDVGEANVGKSINWKSSIPIHYETFVLSACFLFQYNRSIGTAGCE